MANIFPVPFAIANEVVKRTRSDNRRLADKPVDGGNNLFYLGSPDYFLSLFNQNLAHVLRGLQQLCDSRKNNPPNRRTLQKGEGIKTTHLIRKSELLALIPFISSYLESYGTQYHNPNFNGAHVKEELTAWEQEDLHFFSDLTFIRDSTQVKPYFKWFNYPETERYFQLVQEFFIPYLSFLNFEIVESGTDALVVRWHLSYAEFVINCSESIDDVVSNSLRNLPINESEKKTIKEAIVKVRIGQSQFRQALLAIPHRSCQFTGIQQEDLLIASHIKPWSVADSHERTDVNNGVLLTPTFDKLFDKFLLTVDEDGDVLWSRNRLDSETITKLKRGIESLQTINFKLTQENKKYFEFHRAKFHELEDSQINQ